MAVLADIGRGRVRLVFAGRRGAIVAIDAVAGDAGVIKGGGQPACRRMAVVAGISTINMCRCLAGRNRAVVAGAAAAEHLRMVNGKRRGERDHGVAILANSRRLNMRRVLAGGVDAVVAAAAVARNVRVVEVRRNPAGRRMTIVAGVAAADVRRCLAGRDIAVVTRLAGANDLRMIDAKRRHECGGRMAVLANRSGQDMRRILAGRVNAVMAAAATTRDADMVEIGRYPARCRMAIVAGVAARQVRRCLAGRQRAIVTGAAAADDLGMVDAVDRRKLHRVVAILAHVAGLHVIGAFAECIGAVMAAYAVAGDVFVVEVRGDPASGKVAIRAVLAAADMCRRLAGRDIAIVAGLTGADDLRMIDGKHGRERVRCMAILANGSRQNMSNLLAGCVNAVMTARAVAGNADMVEVGRHPARGRVAIIAGVAARQVGWCLAGRQRAVVAGAAAAEYLRMVDRIGRSKRH